MYNQTGEKQVGGARNYQNKFIFQGSNVFIGIFRCAPDQAGFYQTGYFRWKNMITFPRTAVELHMLGKGTLIGSPNVAVFYNNGQRYRRQKLSEAGDRCEWFNYCHATLLEAIQTYDPSVGERHERPFIQTHTPISTRWLILERHIVDYVLTSATPDPMWVDEMALLLLDGILADNYQVHDATYKTKPNTQQIHRNMVIAAQKFMAHHFDQHVTLEQIAGSLHTSPFHLARIFRQQTGFTVHHYLENLRLRIALERLPAYRNDLTTLAFDVGYASHSHFTNAFRRTFGLPPTQITYQLSLSLLNA